MCDSDMYFHIFVLSDDELGANIKSGRSAMVDSNPLWDGELVIDSQDVPARDSREAETA